MAELTTLAADASLDDIVAVLERDGGVIVRDMLGAAAAAGIVEELRGGRESASPGSRSDVELWQGFHGRHTIRFCGLAARSRTFVDRALLNPTLLGVADRYLLPWATDYWLNTGQVMLVGPGEAAQYLHRDQNNWPEAVHPDKELTISCMFALTDFTEDNGATVVVPGSHLEVEENVQRGADYAPERLANATMPAGSGMIYTGKVTHGAGANATDEWRYGMHVSFVLGWLRPEEASPIAVDRETAAQLPKRARQLLGWSSYHSDGGGRTWLIDFEDTADLFG